VRIAVVLLARRAAFAQSTHLLVVVGLAGDPEHGELFQEVGHDAGRVASRKLGVDKAIVTLLATPPRPGMR
jgi:hypothetical protein